MNCLDFCYYTPLTFTIYKCQICTPKPDRNVNIKTSETLRRQPRPRCPLGRLIYKGKIDLVNYLLKLGHTVNQTNRSGETPLFLACSIGSKPLAKLLLQQDGVKVDLMTKYGETALHMAAKTGMEEIVEMLLAKGADPNSRSLLNRNSPLHFATPAPSNAVCQSSVSDDVKDTLLFYTTSKCVRVLLSAGAEIEVTNDEGLTPLASAAQSGATGIVRLLLSAGASTRTLPTDDWLGPVTYSRNMTRVIMEFSNKPPKLTTLCRNVVNKHYGLAANKDSALPTVIKEFLSYDRLQL